MFHHGRWVPEWPGFQKMREDLRRDSSEIWVIDCSPEVISQMCRRASFRCSAAGVHRPCRTFRKQEP